MRLLSAILMGLIAIVFLFFAGFTENVGAAFTFVLLAILSMFSSFWIYFGNMQMK